MIVGSAPRNGSSRDAIGEALTRILASEAFANSKRLRRFLAYVVEKSLAGELDDIKEYNIGLAVFDRDGTFDPRIDSIVRVEARRMRQQLAAFYQAEGRDERVVIEIPRGSYSPVFRDGHAAAAAGRRRLARSRAWGLAAAGVLLASLGAMAILWGGSRRPHHWSVDGSKLRILDSRDRLVWEKQFPAFHGDYDTFVRDKALIRDIDGDGREEVLFTTHPDGHGAGSDTLICFDRRGQRRWEFVYGGRKTFGDRSFDGSYAGRFVRFVRGGGRHYILTGACHKIWYPAQLALLDPSTGKVVEEYWHPGSVYFLELHDLDRDGDNEVVLGAINNPGTGLGHAAMAVLKIPFSRAGRPRTGATGGGELAYRLFPHPDVCRIMGRLPIPARMAVDQNHHIVFQTPLVEDGGLVYTFDFNLNLLEFRASDQFAPLHERYYRQKLLNHRLTAAELAGLGRVAAFDAAPDGNSLEVKNALDPE